VTQKTSHPTHERYENGPLQAGERAVRGSFVRPTDNQNEGFTTKNSPVCTQHQPDTLDAKFGVALLDVDHALVQPCLFRRKRSFAPCHARCNFPALPSCVSPCHVNLAIINDTPPPCSRNETCLWILKKKVNRRLGQALMVP